MSEKKKYFAKSKLKNGKQVTVDEHNEEVSHRASKFGKPIDMEKEAEVAGIFHDFGKYGEDFQDVLKNAKHNVDHAVCGAAILYNIINNKIKLASSSKKTPYHSIIEAVNGHHDGLKYIGDIKDYLRTNILSDEKISVNGGRYSALSGRGEYQKAFETFCNEHSSFKFPPIDSNKLNGAANIQYMLFTRMLFSCLVDADHSVSAYEEDETYFERAEDNTFDAEKYLASLYEYMETVKSNSDSDKELNEIRNNLFEVCGKCGDSCDEGLFTLTAPTGTGKTLALLHFALRHCLATGKKRIIIVLPFLTLAEQNTKIYESIIHNVLVDHSQSNISDEAREFAMRWSSPFIVTTSVKFFETLFSYKPTDCRKIHNIANSVVVFDEAQTLPNEITVSTLKAVNELCMRYHTTMVFSTATQPEFSAIPAVRDMWKPTEIMPNNEDMYRKLKRTEVEWQIDNPMAIENISERMAEHESVCGIFNLRKHARKAYKELYGILSERGEENSVFLLTTDLCPAHRSRVIASIHERLNNGLPCRVVATQCIEAGVDLDFKVLYRALAPLDSIIQSAGRCNRNGRESLGKVIVFVPDEDKLYPDANYGNAAKLVGFFVSNKNNGIDINSPNDIKKYYAELFKNLNDKPELTDAIQKNNYEAVDREYSLINNTGVRIIVPYCRELYDEAWEDIIENGITKQWMKKTAGITVTIFENDDLETYAEPVFYRINGRKSGQRSGYYFLRKQFEDCYSERTGLEFVKNDENSTVIF